MMENLEQILKRIHAERYETNDKGFGRLYADIFKDKHRYNPQRKDFMLYDGKRWIDDTEGLAAKTDAKLLSDALVRFAISVDEQGKYLKSVMPLCNIRNRNNMLQDSKDIYYEVYAQWCDDCGYGCENKSNFFSELKTKGIFASSGTVSGKTIRNVLKGYSRDENFTQIENTTDIPFE